MPAWHTHPTSGWSSEAIWRRLPVAVRRHRVVAGEPHDRRRRTTLFSIGMALPVARGGLADPRPRRGLPLLGPHGAAPAVHARRAAAADRGDAGVAVAGHPAAAMAVRARLRFLTRPVVALILFNGAAAVHPLARGGRRVGALRARALHPARPAGRVGDRDVVAGDVAARRDARRCPPPGQMMYLFVQSLAPTIPASFLTFGHTLAVSRVRDLPADLGHLGAERPADRRARS